jgi:YfiH family protein
MLLKAITLSAQSGIQHGFFTREGGVSDGIYASLNGGTGSNDDRERVIENRKRMAAALGCTPDNFLTAYQIHSPEVVVADTPWPQDQRPKADAIVTKTKNLAIGIATADCGPVLLADAQAGVIGAAHAGWRGALTGVIEAAIAAMEKLGAQKKNIVGALGPTISQRNYEVGQELVDRFVAENAVNAKFFAPSVRAGHSMFDLPGYIGSRFARAGVAFEDLALCTYADPARFYSYRRTTHRGEADYGRHINSIVLPE